MRSDEQSVDVLIVVLREPLSAVIAHAWVCAPDIKSASNRDVAG